MKATLTDNFLDYDKINTLAKVSKPTEERLNEILKTQLSSEHYIVYMMLFFEEKSEEEVAKFMGYKTNEKNRKAGYKQIKNLKKMLREKAEEIIRENDIILD